MELFLTSRKHLYEASGIFNENDRKLTVLKGSRVSKSISRGTFRSAKAIIKIRNERCDEQGIVLSDVCFNSASSAANFITGVSTNGLIAWKDINGRCLKELIGGE